MTSLNVKVCPLHPADVCISFDASETFDYVVVGTMSGRSYVYQNKHIFSLLSLTRSLPHYNSKQNTNYYTENNMPFQLLSPCQTISIVGKLDQKYHIDHSNPDEVIKATQWTSIPKYTPIRQTFPLTINCNDQYILQSDLDAIANLYSQNLLKQRQSPQQSPQQSPNNKKSSLLPLFDPVRHVYMEPAEYICKKLVESNSEPVKGVYIVPSGESNYQGQLVPGSIILALGDTMLKVSQTVKSPTLFNLKYQRTHDARICQLTYCLLYQTVSALVMPGDDALRPVILDAASLKQSSLQTLPIPHVATPLYLYNSNLFNPILKPQNIPNNLYIAWREYLSGQHITSLLMASTTLQRVTDGLYYSETKRPIGFKQSGSRVVSIVEANHVQVNTIMPIDLTQCTEEYYDVAARRILVDSEPYDPENDTNDRDRAEPLMSIEEQEELLVDELLLNGSILNAIQQRRKVHDNEIAVMGSKLVLFANKYLAEVHNGNREEDQFDQDIGDSGKKKSSIYSISQIRDMISFHDANPSLFSPLTIPSSFIKRLYDPQTAVEQETKTNWVSIEGFPTPDKHNERNELIECRQGLLQSAYIDWLSDKPLVREDIRSQNNDQNNNQNEVTSPTTQTPSSSLLTLSNYSNPIHNTHHERIPYKTPFNPTFNSDDITTFPNLPSHLSKDFGGKTTDGNKWSPSGHIIPSNLLKPGKHESPYHELLHYSKAFRAIKFCAHKRGHILGVETEFDGNLIITIGTDFKIKIWLRGELICKFTNILGNLLCTSVVLIKRIGRCIYYTCCDGVYCVILPFDIVIDTIGTNVFSISQILSKYQQDIDGFTQKTPHLYQPDVHIDVKSRDYEPRFYLRSLHVCDEHCHGGSVVFSAPKLVGPNPQNNVGKSSNNNNNDLRKSNIINKGDDDNNNNNNNNRNNPISTAQTQSQSNNDPDGINSNQTDQVVIDINL